MWLLPDTSVEKGRKLGLPPPPSRSFQDIDLYFPNNLPDCSSFGSYRRLQWKSKVETGICVCRAIQRAGRAGGPEVDSAEPVESQA